MSRRREIPGPERSRVGEAVRGMRYDAVFLDVDGTLLWVDVDRRGNVEAPEATFVVRDLGELPDLLRG